MIQDYRKNNETAPIFHDEDDEFGGGFLSVDKIFGKKPVNNPVILTETCDISDVEKPEFDDDDDEYGGGKITVDMIGRNASKLQTVLDELTPPPVKTVNQSKSLQTVLDEVKSISNTAKTKSKTSNTITLIPPKNEQVRIRKKDKVKPLIKCHYKIFSPMIPTNEWYVDRKKLTDTITNPYQSITIPYSADTEYNNQQLDVKDYQQSARLPLTSQIRGIGTDVPKKVFSLHDEVNFGRRMANMEEFPTIKTDFHPVDYLRSLGLEADIKEGTESELSQIPKCFFVMYAYFATAEINIIANGTVKKRLKGLEKSQGDEQISSSRRAYCQTIVEGQKLDYVSLKHIITINGYPYEACFKLVDAGAIHGQSSMSAVSKAVGWKMKYKDVFTKAQKANMLAMSIEFPLEFENYALGDLDLYDILNCYYEQWKIVYEKLGLKDYFQCPKLTIGGTVKDLCEAAIAAKLEITPTDDDGKSIWRKPLNEIVEQFIKPSSANDLRQFTTFTRALLAKVEGGRCRNNRPTDIFIRRKEKGQYDVNLICDIDISGCYGEGQRNQSYFLGIPEIFDYKASKNNEYITLREWLKSYGVDVEKLIKAVNDKDTKALNNTDNWGELISGAWYARINTKKRLKHSQDYFASWFTDTADRVDLLAKSIRNMKSDTEMISTDWSDFDEDCGSLKNFNNEIWNGVLTHDGLQWILAICTPRQRNELLDNVQILASSVYPRSQKIEELKPKDALEKLQSDYDNWDGKNTTERVKVNGRSKIVMNFDECHTWFDINLGDLLVNTLLIERKKAQKVDGKKSPLDILFKLCVNTLYGDMVSKYFITSNPVVGNNITARARCLAWFMEKGLHGWQSITDGCAFELNGVMYEGQDKISGEVINQHRPNSKLKNRKIRRSPLSNAQEILGYWVEYTAYNPDKPDKKEIKFALGLKIDDKDISPVIKPDEEHKGCQTAYSPCMEWIDQAAMIHLQSLFPLVDVLNSETTTIKINDDLTTTFKPRIGQFIFETKDVYRCGSFHGSANYLLSNPNGTNIKARGYEITKTHSAIGSDNVSEGDEVVFMKSERYGVENNPAKDLMNQLLENAESVKRQLPAIKTGILKITDYKNTHDKYDDLGIEPGDNIQRAFLLQEFSLSQFTFQTYEQYMMWKQIISHLKNSDRQSLEGYFLNDDGSLNFIKMSNWVEEQIMEGIDKPFDLLSDPNDNDKRAEKRAKQALKVGKGNGTGKGKKQKIISLSHPHLETFNALRERLKLSEESNPD
jgi:hypothetical protein